MSRHTAHSLARRPELIGEATPNRKGEIELNENTREAARELARNFCRDLIASSEDNRAIPDEMLDEIRNIAAPDMKESSELSSSLLEGRLQEKTEENVGKKSGIATNLAQLRVQIDRLNPGRRKFFGLVPIPFHEMVRKYESSADHVEAILKALEDSANNVALDSQTLHVDRSKLRKHMLNLSKSIFTLEEFDKELSEQIEALDATDPERADYLRSTVLVEARQRHQDVKMHLLVLAQAHKGIDLSLDNHAMLQREVSRVSTTTVTALKTALIMKHAALGQKQMHDIMDSTKEVTERLMESAVDDITEVSARNSERASSTVIDLGKLRDAWDKLDQAQIAADEARAHAAEDIKQNLAALESSIRHQGPAQLSSEPQGKKYASLTDGS